MNIVYPTSCIFYRSIVFFNMTLTFNLVENRCSPLALCITHSPFISFMNLNQTTLCKKKKFPKPERLLAGCHQPFFASFQHLY